MNNIKIRIREHRDGTEVEEIVINSLDDEIELRPMSLRISSEDLVNIGVLKDKDYFLTIEFIR